MMGRVVQGRSVVVRMLIPAGRVAPVATTTVTMAVAGAVEQAVASTRVAAVGHTMALVLDQETLSSTEGLAETDIMAMVLQALGASAAVEVMETTAAARVAVTAVVLQGASIIIQEQAAAATSIAAPRQSQSLLLLRAARSSKSSRLNDRSGLEWRRGEMGTSTGTPITGTGTGTDTGTALVLTLIVLADYNSCRPVVTLQNRPMGIDVRFAGQ